MITILEIVMNESADARRGTYYINNIEGDFSKYVEKYNENEEWGGIVELFSFSNMIDV